MARTTTSLLVTQKRHQSGLGIDLMAQAQIFTNSSLTGNLVEVVMDPATAAMFTPSLKVDVNGVLYVTMTEKFTDTTDPIAKVVLMPPNGANGGTAANFAPNLVLIVPGTATIVTPTSSGTTVSSNATTGGAVPITGGITMSGTLPTTPSTGAAPAAATLTTTQN